MKRQLRMIFAVFATFAVLATACGSDNKGAAAPATDEDSSVSTVDDAGPTSTVAPKPDEPQTEAEARGTLRYGVSLGVRTWDPHPETRTFAMTFFDVVYDGLINEEPDGTLVPGLATEWELTNDSLTMQLREDVLFHDGTPFDADAVAYNVEKVKATPGTAGLSFSAVDSVEIVSPTEVVLKLNRPAPELPVALSHAQGRMLSPAVSPEDVAAGVPAGTGPYMLVENTEDGYAMEPFAGFWDSSQQGLERVEFRIIGDDDARLNALLTGEVDMAFIRGGQAGPAGDAGFEVAQTISNVSVFQITDIGGEIVPEFADERVRTALAYAIDREAWGAAVARGFGSPANQILEPGKPFFLEGYEGISFDPDMSRSLLADAGVTDLEFEIAAFGPFNLGAQALQAMFADVGVTMNIRSVGPAELTPTIAGGEVAAAYVFIPDTHAEAIWNKHLAPGSIYNSFGATLDDVESAHAEAAKSADTAPYQHMLQAVYDSGWIDPIWYNASLLAYDPDAFGEIQPWDFVTLGFKIRGLTGTS